MSTNNSEVIVKDFMKKVKEKLPEWLKDKKEELKDTLAEIESHIWDKAEDLSGSSQPREDSVRTAIAHMGTPASIAREYKRRGTPKYFISEELWDIYKKVIAIVFGIIFVVNVAIIVFNTIFGNFSVDLSLSFSGITAAFTVITVIFVALSHEGYFPEDFVSASELKKKERNIKKAEALGIPVSKRSGKQLKPFIKTGGKIAEGVFNMVFGILLIVQPIPNIIAYLNPQLLVLLQIWGIITLSEGCLLLIRGIIGNQQPQTHQILIGFNMALKVINALSLILVILNPAMIPWINFNQNPPLITTIIPEAHDLARGIVVLIMAIILLTMIEEIYWMVKLEQYKA